MRRPFSIKVILFLLLVVASAGCHPTQPFFYQEDGDLSHYLDKATQVENPDVFTASLAEVENTMAPLTLTNTDFNEFVEYTLEDTVHIALQNSKVIRTLASVRQFGQQGVTGTGAGRGETTFYDPAILSSDPQNGVEAALSAFDAELAITNPLSGGLYERNVRPQNNVFFGNVIKQENGGLRTELRKRTATGATFNLITENTYSQTNAAFRALSNTWESNLLLQWRQPLLRGRGTQVNRVPVVLARINEDISIATVESSVRNLVMDIERTYWDLAVSYRILEATKAIRDSAHRVWQSEYVRYAQGAEAVVVEAPAREQFFFFQSQTEQALRDLLSSENNIRYLMGLTSSDGRVIRPSDPPATARVEFDWREVHAESIARTAELRQQRWLIKQRELDLITARNRLLPQFDLISDYGWYGIGSDLIHGDGNNEQFPHPNSGAVNELLGGDYQEVRVRMEFLHRIGMRQELANLRNSQLQLAREKARLEDLELYQSHQLTTAIRDADANYELAQTNFNRWTAANQELEARQTLIEKGAARFDLNMLDAQRRWYQALVDFLRALGEYNKSLAFVHFQKGSLLDHNSITLAEGPWAQKAYWDAVERARERDASYYLDYGWTRPRVVSQGPVSQITGVTGEIIDANPTKSGTRPDEQPTPATPPSNTPEAGPVTRSDDGSPPDLAKGAARMDSFDWGELNALMKKATTSNESRVQPASHEDEVESKPVSSKTKR